MTLWLIREDVGMEMAQAARALAPITPSMRAEFAGKTRASGEAQAASEGPRILRVAGDTAEIDVLGVLTEQEDFWLWLLGYENTAYADIRESLMRAQQDPAVSRVILRVNSPGGTVDGLFETVAALQAFSKPMEARVKMACSGAYAIASMAGTIVAEMAASCVGSVGVVTTYYVDDAEVHITSTEAPEKRPDVRTDHGKAVVRKHLDDIHDLFSDAIASGRKTTQERVNAEFGRGGVFLAAEALRVGMIDAIAPALHAVGIRANASSGIGAQKENTMDLKTLKASHRDVYEEAAAEGASAAVTNERKRVNAHLKMGKQCGAMDIAIAAIASGAAFADEEVQADYMVAAQKRTAVAERAEDTQVAEAAVAGAAAEPAPAAKDVGDEIVALMEKQGV